MASASPAGDRPDNVYTIQTDDVPQWLQHNNATWIVGDLHQPDPNSPVQWYVFCTFRYRAPTIATDGSVRDAGGLDVTTPNWEVEDLQFGQFTKDYQIF